MFAILQTCMYIIVLVLTAIVIGGIGVIVIYGVPYLLSRLREEIDLAIEEDRKRRIKIVADDDDFFETISADLKKRDSLFFENV